MDESNIPQDNKLLFRPFAPGYGIAWLESTFIPQSIIFMHDMIKSIHALCASIYYSSHEVITILDVGAGSAAGTDFLAKVLLNLRGLKVEVTALEKDQRFERYAQKNFSEVKFLVKDIFDFDMSKQYDIVIASHTIEHIEKPLIFVKRLRQLAKEFVVIYAPFEEQQLIAGHINHIDAIFIRNLPGVFWATALTSMGWHTEANSRTVIAVLASDTSSHLHNLEQLQSTLDHEYGSQMLVPLTNEPDIPSAVVSCKPMQSIRDYVGKFAQVVQQVGRSAAIAKVMRKLSGQQTAAVINQRQRLKKILQKGQSLLGRRLYEASTNYACPADFRRAVLLPHVTLPCHTLEVGAFTAPTIMPHETRLKILDFYSTDELREQARQLGRDTHSVLEVDYLCRSDQYDEVTQESFDLIIANHVFEHVSRPIDWLNCCSRLLRPDGVLFLAIPDKKYSFDKFRSDTSLSQLLFEHFLPERDAKAFQALDATLYYDWGYSGKRNDVTTRLDVSFLKRALDEWHPGLHCHVFQAETFLDFILKPILHLGLVDFGLLEFTNCRAFGEFALVLQKGGEQPRLTEREFFRLAYDTVGPL